MNPVPLIFGTFGVLLLFVLVFRLTDPALWKQDAWQIGIKVGLGLLGVALALALLYLLAPASVLE